jgi:hypothetical protein
MQDKHMQEAWPAQSVLASIGGQKSQPRNPQGQSSELGP